MRRRARTIYFLNQANYVLRSILDGRLRSITMTGIQYTILSLIDRHEGISSAELSRRFFVTAQTMNEIINGMVQRGLISRKEDLANKRILRLKLTARGRKTLKECDTIADEIEHVAFGWMREQELEDLRESLRLLTRVCKRDLMSTNLPAAVTSAGATRRALTRTATPHTHKGDSAF
jgi:DNA-binding MarR family transcriptional regulator